jgi:hypothetical protein
LWEEIAYLGYYLHWPMSELVDLDHRSRSTVIEEVGRINERLNESATPC